LRWTVLRSRSQKIQRHFAGSIARLRRQDDEHNRLIDVAPFFVVDPDTSGFFVSVPVQSDVCIYRPDAVGRGKAIAARCLWQIAL
jgi:hypothetical protein